ncbi:MAG TPA: glycosyltransferase family 2 protein [Gemmatimonadales bacterium]|nr:glycosyltransferase family 2 protein [Gemmatimonadales bacterium]
MIIDITKSGYRKGYLPRHGVGVFHPFFATANAAFRRSALEAVNGFDGRCATGEDIDLCIRVARADYELWFEPSAKVTHFHRSTLRGLLVQWFRYGYGHAYLFRKHGPARRLEFYRYDLSKTNDSPFGIARVLSLPSPVPGMVFLSSYHAMHLGLVGAVAAFAAGARALGWTALLGAAVAAAWYFAPGLDARHPFRSMARSALRYVSDGAYVLGGLLGGFSQGMIYLEATRTRRDRGATAGGRE